MHVIRCALTSEKCYKLFLIFREANMAITANELMGKLVDDKKYQTMIKRNQENRNIELKILVDDEKELVKELNSLGYAVKSVWDFVNNTPHSFLERNFIGKYNSAYPVLVKHLDINHKKMIREGIIRSLIEKDAYDVAGEKLIYHFYKEEDKNLKWILSVACKKVIPLKKRKKYLEIDQYYKDKGNT